MFSQSYGKLGAEQIFALEFYQYFMDMLIDSNLRLGSCRLSRDSYPVWLRNGFVKKGYLLFPNCFIRCFKNKRDVIETSIVHKRFK